MSRLKAGQKGLVGQREGRVLGSSLEPEPCEKVSFSISQSLSTFFRGEWGREVEAIAGQDASQKLHPDRHHGIGWNIRGVPASRSAGTRRPSGVPPINRGIGRRNVKAFMARGPSQEIELEVSRGVEGVHVLKDGEMPMN